MARMTSHILVGGIPTPVKNIGQLGLLFSIYGKNVPNHQPVMVHVEAELNRLGIPGPGPQSIGPPYDARGQNLCLAPVQSLGDSSGWFSNN